MNAILAGIIFAVVLSAGILVLLEIGRRVARRDCIKGPRCDLWIVGFDASILFSGALTRFDAARHLDVEEANDIGTAWLRIALLPEDTQPPCAISSAATWMRGSRSIGGCRTCRTWKPQETALARSTNLQSEIRALAVSSSR